MPAAAGINTQINSLAHHLIFKTSSPPNSFSTSSAARTVPHKKTVWLEMCSPRASRAGKRLRAKCVMSTATDCGVPRAHTKKIVHIGLNRCLGQLRVHVLKRIIHIPTSKGVGSDAAREDRAARANKTTAAAKWCQYPNTPMRLQSDGKQEGWIVEL